MPNKVKGSGLSHPFFSEEDLYLRCGIITERFVSKAFLRGRTALQGKGGVSSIGIS